MSQLESGWAQPIAQTICHLRQVDLPTPVAEFFFKSTTFSAEWYLKRLDYEEFY